MNDVPAVEIGACASQHCITCGDDGDPMTIVSVDLPSGLAVCRSEGGGTETVEIALVEPVAEGDLLLVHAGTAIAALVRDGVAV